ncbi:ER-golgi trafficking TRAPP I complex 85 kDa subunit-domain-containing protein [Blyttiomyces helicus]|uniref:ER-golgi trafficking TRAPP I complex 85 kDa subunit-domain-containing protein n=1 Tax=Blyttiomyces helicus TaxID=388810 RepID=A0A4P9VY14_9FUNG|nr:ER-golgi trafficking TRAPP I complex 85 kDa subunit-domain-containing protein [Blyttiomyces helicus]|eukprot:RKO84142.1 ER-golgi trafficking TRAPP I complex 85 kDa subunit-domain-containing protein [Blyttiomyces helicus]
MTELNGKPLDTYLEAAISGYQDAKAPMLASRVAMLYYEMLRHKDLYRDAPPLLIRMTGDDSDIRSGLFLEQAALCFLRIDPPMVRKYAFHLILAGHRFSKCGQREHAYGAYVAALDVYNGRGWSLIEDHIHFTLGRQSFHLSDMEAAVDFFLKLLRAGRQPASQQSAYLKEFLYIYKQFATRAPADRLAKFATLPLPDLEHSTIRVSLLEGHQPSHVVSSDDAWDSMETELFDEGYSRTPAPLRKTYAGRGNAAAVGKGGKTACAVGGIE